MKRVSIPLVILYVIATILMFPIGTTLWFPPMIRGGYFLIWCVVSFGYWKFYPRRMRKRLRDAENQLGRRCLPIQSASVNHEYFLLDIVGRQLIGLSDLNPFHIQYMDVSSVKHVEITRNTLGNASVTLVVLTMYLEKKSFSIIMHRYQRYERKIKVGSKEDKELMAHVELVKKELLQIGERIK